MQQVQLKSLINNHSKTHIMKTKVSIHDKKTDRKISEEFFQNKKEALAFIKALQIKNDVMAYANFLKTGQCFFIKSIK